MAEFGGSHGDFQSFFGEQADVEPFQGFVHNTVDESQQVATRASFRLEEVYNGQDAFTAIPEPNSQINQSNDIEDFGAGPGCQETITNGDFTFSCNRKPVNQCQISGHEHFSTCTTCHLGQGDHVLPETGKSVIELLRHYHCKDCSESHAHIQEKNDINPDDYPYPVNLGMCACENKLRNTMCNEHKNDAVELVKKIVVGKRGEIMNGLKKDVCPNCDKRQGDLGVDEFFGRTAWECLVCEQLVINNNL